MEKEEIARIEKYAQAHLDRAQSQATGASKTALAWLIALILLWTQNLEPKLTEVRTAQSSLARLNVAKPKGIKLDELSVAQRDEVDNAAGAYRAAFTTATKQEIELPLSIKLKLSPEWVPTLWLALSFSLLCYLFQNRRQVFTLAARGLKLLCCDVNSTPAYVRVTVGNSAWWLAPPPVKSGSHISAEEFHAALRMTGRNRNIATTLVIMSALLLVGIELRVFYVGFCVKSYLVGTALPEHPGHPVAWLLLSFLDISLCCLFFITLWKWFSPLSIQDSFDMSPKIAYGRRAFLQGAPPLLAAMVAGIVTTSSSTMGFAALWEWSKATARGRRKKHRDKRVSYPTLANGFYRNPTTGTIHMVTASCRRCVEGVNAVKFIKISREEVPWTTFSQRIEKPNLQVARNQQSGRVLTLQPQSKSTAGSEALAQPRIHLHKQHYPFLIEQHAIALINEGKSVEACRMLTDALGAYARQTFAVDLRICDLLAGLCVRNGDSHAMASLVQTVTFVNERSIPRLSLGSNKDTPQTYRPGALMTYLYKLSGNRTPKRQRLTHPSQHSERLSIMLTARLNKWQDSKSTWHKRWSDPTKKVRWSWSNGKAARPGLIDIP